MSTIPFWKKIYQTVSGYSQSVTEYIVSEILDISRDEIVQGLLSYKPYTKESFHTWQTPSISPCLKEFIHELGKTLNLTPEVAHSVMCNYLMFEYFGKIKEFWQITRIGTTLRLKESILNFYTAERMFMLKTLRQIFEFAHDIDHPFFAQYTEFIASIKMEELQDNLISVYNSIMHDITASNATRFDKDVGSRICRNYREQTELLMVLTLTVKESKLKTRQMVSLIKLFIRYNFSSQPFFSDLLKVADRRDVHDLLSSIVGCFIVLVESYWDVNPSEFWEISSVKDLHISVVNITTHHGLGIIILIWTIFRTVSYEATSGNIAPYLKSESFMLLQSVVANEIFKNCKVGDTVLRSTHKIIDHLCLMVSDKKTLFEQNGVVGVISEFLTHKELAEICLGKRNGIDSIIEVAFETFPYDYLSFTKIAESLLGLESQYKNVLYLLNNVPSFLSDMTWSVLKENIHCLKEDQRAFADSDLIIFPTNTQVRSYHVFGNNLIQYQATYSYFNYLEYLVNTMVDEGVRFRNFDENLLRKVVAGYQIVLQGIKHCADMDLTVIGLARPINKLTNILPLLEEPIFEIVALYFKVAMAMMTYRNKHFFDLCPKIIWKLFFPKIKLEFAEANLEDLLFNQLMFEDTILVKFFVEEDLKEDHELAVTYTEMIYTMIKMKFEDENFQFSNVAYLINVMFLEHQRWAYKDDAQRTRITTGLLNIIHHILQQKPEDLNENEKNIFYFCQRGMLDNISIIDTFTRLFIKEKYHMTFLMERESNWLKGPSLSKLQCIRMQLALLLLIMKHKHERNQRCVLDDRLPLIVKPVASYFTNSYSPVIAELSCRFLQKLAQDKEVPLLALLELDHYQVQALFLERLRDPLEEDHVKLAIVDLINTCIGSQNGMTAAFFNLKCFMYWDGMDKDTFQGDTVSDFMVDYLQNIKKSHEYFKNPLQLGILTLLHNLWLNHRENLIDNIVGLKDFWPIMMDPFFCQFVQNPQIYAVILKIVNFEIATDTENVEPKLLATIKKFISNKKQINEWLDFILKVCNSHSKHTVDLLAAWTEFIILTKEIASDSYDEETKIAIILNCVDGLVEPQASVKDLEIIYYWSQLYMILVKYWPSYTSKADIVMKKLTTFMYALQFVYGCYPIKIKETIFCGINQTIKTLEKYFIYHTTDLINFLHPLGTIIDLEYNYLDEVVWSDKVADDCEKAELLKPWLIIILICNSLLSLQNVEELGLWFHYRRILKRIMKSTIQMTRYRSTLVFAKLAIHHMICYGETPLARDFLRVGTLKFFSKFRPPSLQISIGKAIVLGVPIDLREWWLIYCMLIKLNRVLINTLDGSILDTCFEFLNLQIDPLKEIVGLTKYTVDMSALSLVCETLKFICTLFSWHEECLSRSPNLYELLMDGVKMTINACTISILGNKRIDFYNITCEKRLLFVDDVPTELFSSILNKLVEIIYWGASCLKNTKPSLLKLLKIYLPTESIPLEIKNEFSVPRFDVPITSELTYGKLLCLIHYLCKALNQLSPETPVITPRTRQVQMSFLRDDIKVKSLRKIFEHCTATYEQFIGFMDYLQSDELLNEKLSSFVHYDAIEFSKSSQALSQLNYRLVQSTLEVLMTFLTMEITLNIRNLKASSLYVYKRELCSEVQFFYEFVRKRTTEFFTMAANPRTLTYIKSEPDVVQKYMLMKKQENQVSHVLDNNFILVIAQWLIKFCDIN